MAIKQISIFVENKKGALADVLGCLRDKGVSLRAMSIADTQDFGILRIIVDDNAAAAKALTEGEIVFSVNDVVAAEAADVPGGLAAVLKVLLDANIDIEYTYAFVVENGARACAILRLSDTELGEKVLTEAGIPMVSEEDILRI